MATTLLLTLLAIPGATPVMRQEPAPAVQWRPYAEGLDEAKRLGMPIFVVARAPNSFWCQLHAEEMAKSRSNVRRINEKFVPVVLSWTERDVRDIPAIESLGI